MGVHREVEMEALLHPRYRKIFGLAMGKLFAVLSLLAAVFLLDACTPIRERRARRPAPSFPAQKARPTDSTRSARATREDDRQDSSLHHVL